MTTTNPSSPSRQPPHALVRVGIGIGTGGRLSDGAAAASLAFAAEQIGYTSVWTFDTPPGADRSRRARAPDAMLATLHDFSEATAQILIGAGVLSASPPGHEWMDGAATLHRANGGRLIIASRADLGDLDDPSTTAMTGPTLLELWTASSGALPEGVDGWLIDGSTGDPGPVVARDERLVVRLPVDGRTLYSVAELISGVSKRDRIEVVLDVVEDVGVDQALDWYARIAEAVES